MYGLLDFDDSFEFDSCIHVTATTLTLFLSSTTHSSVSLMPNPLALTCRTLNVLSSLISSTGVRGGNRWVFEGERG